MEEKDLPGIFWSSIILLVTKVCYVFSHFLYFQMFLKNKLCFYFIIIFNKRKSFNHILKESRFQREDYRGFQVLKTFYISRNSFTLALILLFLYFVPLNITLETI